MIQNQWICLLKNIEEIFRCNKTKTKRKILSTGCELQNYFYINVTHTKKKLDYFTKFLIYFIFNAIICKVPKK